MSGIYYHDADLTFDLDGFDHCCTVTIGYTYDKGWRGNLTAPPEGPSVTIESARASSTIKSADGKTMSVPRKIPDWILDPILTDPSFWDYLVAMHQERD